MPITYCYISYLAILKIWLELSWWLYSCWIYNYLCNHWLSPPKLWVWMLLMTRCTRYHTKW